MSGQTAHCETCDGEELTGTSTGCYFDVEGQRWMVGDAIDNIRCEDCDEYTEVIWKEIK